MSPNEAGLVAIALNLRRRGCEGREFTIDKQAYMFRVFTNAVLTPLLLRVPKALKIVFIYVSYSGDVKKDEKKTIFFAL